MFLYQLFTYSEVKLLSAYLGLQCFASERGSTAVARGNYSRLEFDSAADLMAASLNNFCQSTFTGFFFNSMFYYHTSNCVCGL